MENEETPSVQPAVETVAQTESPAAEAAPEAAPEPAFNVWEAEDVDWLDDPTLANGPDLTLAEFNELPAGAKRAFAKVRAQYQKKQAETQAEMQETRALRDEIDRLRVSRLKELADLQRHVQRERFRALDKPVELPNVDPSSAEYINAMVAKAVAEKVAQFQQDLQGMTQGAADEVARIEQQQAANTMQEHTVKELESIQNPHIRKEFVRELKEHAARYHGGKFHQQGDLESAIEMTKLKLGLIQRNTEEFIPKSYKEENAPPKSLDEVYGDYADMSAGQLAQLMMDHPEEADKILKRRKRYLSER